MQKALETSRSSKNGTPAIRSQNRNTHENSESTVSANYSRSRRSGRPAFWMPSCLLGSAGRPELSNSRAANHCTGAMNKPLDLKRELFLRDVIS